MAATPIYGKNFQKSFFSRMGNPMILKLGMQHQGLKLYKVYINDDPGLTSTYFMTISNLPKIVFVLTVGPDFRSNLVAYMFVWGKLLQSHLMGKTCSKELN